MSPTPAQIRKPREVMRALEQLANEHGGNLTPELVVTKARDKNSPLHDEFTWNDSRAAHHYRLLQARKLLRVCMVWKVGKTETNAPRFFRVQVVDGGKKEYVQSKKVFQDPDLTRRAAIEAFNHFRNSVKVLEPFPRYFRDLLRVVNEAMALVKFEDEVKSEAM